MLLFPPPHLLLCRLPQLKAPHFSPPVPSILLPPLWPSSPPAVVLFALDISKECTCHSHSLYSPYIPSHLSPFPIPIPSGSPYAYTLPPSSKEERKRVILVFCVWFISLYTIISSSSHLFANNMISLFIVEWDSTMYVIPVLPLSSCVLMDSRLIACIGYCG